MSIEIRLAKLDEIDLLTDLAVRSKAYWGYPKEFIESCSEELAVTLEKINDVRFKYFAAERGNQIVGFYALERISETQFELEALFIDPLFIRKGIGSKLILHAKEFVFHSGGTDIIIQGDPNAKPFYESMGCVLVGKRESTSIPGRYLPVFNLRVADKPF